jgi:hypothetical protein
MGFYQFRYTIVLALFNFSTAAIPPRFSTIVMSIMMHTQENRRSIIHTLCLDVFLVI